MRAPLGHTQPDPGAAAGRAQKVVPLVIFLCALAVRGAYVSHVRGDMRFPDERCYWRVAENVRQGRGLVLDTELQVARAPVYPLLLAASQGLFPHSLVPIRLAQAVVSAVTCLLVFYLGRAVFGQAAGLWAGAMAAVYPFFVFYTGLVLSETLFIALLVLLVMLEWRVLSHSSPWAAAATGVVAGLAALTRPSALLLPLLALPLLFVGTPRKGRRAVCVALLLLGLAAVMAPWVWRNYRVTGRFVPTTLQVGASLYESNSPGADGGPAMDRTKWPPEARGLSEYDRNQYLFKQAVAFIRSDWPRFGRLCLHRCKRFWNLLPNYSDYRRPGYAMLSLASYGPVLVLGCIGLVLSLRRGRATLLLLLPVVYFACLHAVFVGSTRYRTPIMPMIMVFAGQALAVNQAERRRRGRRPCTKEQRAARAAVLLAAAGVGTLGWYTCISQGKLREWVCLGLANRLGGSASFQDVRLNAWSGLVVRGASFEVTVPGALPATIRAQESRAAIRWLPLVNRRVVVDRVRLDGFSILARLKPRSKVHVPDVIAFVAELVRSIGHPTIAVHGTLRVVEEDRTLAELLDWRVSLFPKQGRGTVYTLQSSWRDPRWGRFELTGSLDVSGPHLDIAIEKEGVRLTDEVLNALPGVAGRACREAGVSNGEAGLTLSVSYEEGKDADIRKAVAIQLKNVAFVHKAFPYPVHNARGRIEVDERSIKLSGVRADAEGAELHLRDAQLQLPPPPGAMLTLEAKSLRLGARLRSCLPADVQKVWDYFTPRGQADATVALEWHADETVPSLAKTSVRLKQCQMAYDDFPLPIHDLTGTVDLLGDRALLRNLKGRFDKGQLSVEQCTVYYDPAAQFDLAIECRSLPLNAQFHDALGEGLKALWVQLRPEGTASGTYRVQKKAGEKAPFVHQLTFKPDSNRIRCERLGIPLAQITGTVVCSDDVEGTLQIAAKSQDSAVSLSGSFGPQKLSLKFQAPHLELTPALFHDMPPAVKQWHERVRPNGHIEVNVQVSRDAAQGPTTVDGELVLNECGADIKARLTDCSGRITFSGQLGPPGKRTLAGQAHIRAARIRGRLLSDLRFAYREDKGEIAIDGLKGKLAGGALAGQVKITEATPERPARYGGSLAAEGIRLERLLDEADKPKYESLRGRLAVSMAFDAATDRHGSLKGNGEVRVREGKLGDLPLLLGIINLAKLAPLDAGIFSRADLAYQVENQTIRFTKADLVGPVLSLFGTGVVNEDKELSFRFRPELGKEGDNVLASRVMNAAKNMLFPVVLGGTYDAPSWKMVPLLDITLVIRGLLGAASEAASAKDRPPPARER